MHTPSLVHRVEGRGQGDRLICKEKVRVAGTGIFSILGTFLTLSHLSAFGIDIDIQYGSIEFEQPPLIQLPFGNVV